ncbi:MAG: histidine phosphatase family protein [Alphaproteobacteria bacterium]|nr:histidine phosphatase family protein [Alphaproteobacteria bacterium]MDE2629972.1 histidine phosphatase family protein [Alphaproteobacteria bacterium]
MLIALIRHGPTEWNAQHRVQGSVDTPLSEQGRARMARLLPPMGFETVRSFCSPKLRARQTAELLGLKNPTIDERLAEQNWGNWEGLTRAQMLARDGDDAFTRAGRGLAFRPPGGESTGELQARVISFFVCVAEIPQDAIAVTHMGVLRAGYVLATGWNMSTPMPAGLDLAAALVLSLDAHGTPSVAVLNAPLRMRAG